MITMGMDAILDDPKILKEVVYYMRKGAIFVYPTDTVYGIGCNALKNDSVLAIRNIKNSQQPFSVIAPSKKWIKHKMNVLHYDYLKKLPGPYTFVFEKKRKSMLATSSQSSYLGIRIPKHPFSKLVSIAEIPFITTSANISGKPVIHRLKELPKSIIDRADFAIDGGMLGKKASKVVDLTGSDPLVLRE